MHSIFSDLHESLQDISNLLNDQIQLSGFENDISQSQKSVKSKRISGNSIQHDYYLVRLWPIQNNCLR